MHLSDMISKRNTFYLLHDIGTDFSRRPIPSNAGRTLALNDRCIGSASPAQPAELRGP